MEQLVDKRERYITKLFRNMRTHASLYIFTLPALAGIILFSYVPIYGLQIAFRDFSPVKGILDSDWVGLKHFVRFLGSYQFGMLLENTLVLALENIILTFPVPVILAVFIHQLREGRAKTLVQTVVYIPHFVSTVVLVGIMAIFLSPRSGLVGNWVAMMGGERVHYMGREEWFRPLYILSEIWQHAGWESIIFVATLAGVDPTLYEAAEIDGAGRFRRILHIDLPMLASTMLIIFIMKTGYILNSGGSALSPAFEKVYLMQNDLNEGVSEVLSTYVYKIGLQSHQYSYSTAIGLFNTLFSFVVVVILNHTSHKVTGAGLW